MANEDKKDFNAMLRDNKDMPKVQLITDEKSIAKYGGNRMYFAPPMDYDAVMRRVPRGKLTTVGAIREYFAKKNGAQVVGITDSEMSPLYAEADVCLCACTDMASFVDSLAAPLSVINALIVSVWLNRREELGAHFKRQEGIWNAHSVYIDRQDE